MKNFIHKYEIWTFLFLAPSLNTVATYLNSEDIIKGLVYTHGRFYALLLLLICIANYTRGIEGVKDMFRPMLNWKVNSFWYVFRLLFALTIVSMTLLMKGIYYGGDYFQFFKLSFPI